MGHGFELWSTFEFFWFLADPHCCTKHSCAICWVSQSRTLTQTWSSSIWTPWKYSTDSALPGPESQSTTTSWYHPCKPPAQHDEALPWVCRKTADQTQPLWNLCCSYDLQVALGAEYPSTETQASRRSVYRYRASWQLVLDPEQSMLAPVMELQDNICLDWNTRHGTDRTLCSWSNSTVLNHGAPQNHRWTCDGHGKADLEYLLSLVWVPLFLQPASLGQCLLLVPWVTNKLEGAGEK